MKTEQMFDAGRACFHQHYSQNHQTISIHHTLTAVLPSGCGSLWGGGGMPLRDPWGPGSACKNTAGAHKGANQGGRENPGLAVEMISTAASALHPPTSSATWNKGLNL